MIGASSTSTITDFTSSTDAETEARLDDVVGGRKWGRGILGHPGGIVSLTYRGTRHGPHSAHFRARAEQGSGRPSHAPLRCRGRPARGCCPFTRFDREGLLRGIERLMTSEPGGALIVTLQETSPGIWDLGTPL